MTQSVIQARQIPRCSGPGKSRAERRRQVLSAAVDAVIGKLERSMVDGDAQLRAEDLMGSIRMAEFPACHLDEYSVRRKVLDDFPGVSLTFILSHYVSSSMK